MAVMGNTVRLKVSFYNFDGDPSDPTDVKLRIYDDKRKEIESFNLTQENQAGVGNFYYDYVVPRGKGELTFEFTGTLEGTPITERGLLRREWIRE